MIWKTDGLREASTKKLILYFAGGSRIPYTGWNHPDIMMLSASNESWWNYTDVMRWCYVDDIIAQADKAEQLEKENEAMREEFELWHYNHKCLLEDLETVRKAIGQVMSMGAKNNICYNLKAKTVKSILGNALKQIEHKETK